VDEVAFGRYRLLSLIGQGGMGKVYKAHDTLFGRDVAIKVLPSELSVEEEYRQRFRREALTAARLGEPHVIPIFDTGDIDGQLYLVMQLVEGTDIGGLLERDGPLNPERAVYILEQLAAALDAAHAAGLVHRDVKPSNALVTGQDFAYLIDFGIAHSASGTKLTSANMLLGTLTYMAPERFEGVVDARSDIYALACVLHECLTGNQPYPGDSMQQQLNAHLNMDPPRPSERRADLPAGFDDVIAAGMAKDPDERYQTAHELAAAARQALTTAPSPTPRTASRAADTAIRLHADPTRAARGSTPVEDLPAVEAPEADPEDPADDDLLTAQQDSPDESPAASPDSDDAPSTQPVATLRRRRPSPLVVVVVATTLAAGIIGIGGYLSRPHSSARQSPAGLSTGSTPVTPAALQGLLLSPDQLDTAMGATGMTVSGTFTAPPDASGQVPDKACIPLEGPGQATAYANSGWTGVSGQRVADQSHRVQQIVVSFPSAQDARTFFTTSAEGWPACANRQHDENTTDGQRQVHTVGPVSNTNGTLSATITGVLTRNGSSATCERALTVANNVAIDIGVCGVSPSGAAINIADQISAKVPTT
jgi:serine/threonine protein kinase